MRCFRLLSARLLRRQSAIQPLDAAEQRNLDRLRQQREAKQREED